MSSNEANQFSMGNDHIYWLMRGVTYHYDVTDNHYAFNYGNSDVR